MKKHIVFLCIISALMLAACRPGGPQTTNQPDNTTPPTIQTTPPAETTLPAETTQPTETVINELELFDSMFGDLNSWYNKALTCQYESPEEINLKQMFYRGFSDESKKPTDEEWEQLKNQHGFDINMDLLRLPVEKMNEVLTAYFGITLEDVEAAGFDQLVYLESFDCYYHMCTDTNVVEGFQATAVEKQDDGSIRIFYTTDRDDVSYVVTVMPIEDGYQILSNVAA